MKSFVTVFQPIVTKTSNIVAVEALSRIYSDGLLLPAEESIAFIRANDLVLIRAALNNFERLVRFTNLKLLINIERSNVSTFNFGTFFEALKLINLVPKRLIFEITERGALTQDVMQFARQCRANGIGIALDDTQSLSHAITEIYTLAPDVVKIECSDFNDFLDFEPDALKLIEICKIAHSLGARCILEHVSSESIFKDCDIIPVDAYQGFLFSKPRTVKEMIAILESTSKCFKIDTDFLKTSESAQ